MSRTSRDEIKHGRVWNGYDYRLQVWIKDGIITNVGTGRHLAGQCIRDVAGAEEPLTERSVMETN